MGTYLRAKERHMPHGITVLPATGERAHLNSSQSGR